MPYPQSDDAFRALTLKILDDADIREEMDRVGGGYDAVSHELETHKQEAWASAAESIKLHDEAEIQRDAEFARLNRERPVKTRLHSWVEQAAVAFGVLLILLFIAFIAGWIWKGLAWNWSQMLKPASMSLGGFYLALAIPSWALSGRMGARFNRRTGEFETHRVETLGRLDEQRAAAREQVDQAMAQQLKSEARGFLESLKLPVFGTDLPKSSAEGLAEVLNTSFEITTESRKKVLSLIGDMHGAAIGIAGPRGVGKTTLLWSICQSGDTDPNVLSVFTSAPVKYEPRDFLLHLFSTVCSRVIEKQKGLRSQAPWRELLELRDESVGVQMHRLRHAASLATILGMILLAVGILLAFAGAVAAVQNPTASQTASKAQPAPANATPTKSDADVSAVMKALDLKPGPFLLWGIVLFVSGAYLGRYSKADKEFFPFSVVGQPWKDDAERSQRAAGLADDQDAKLNDLGKEARRLQAAIRFQQTYSSGWTGSLKLPVGLETGVSSAVQWAQQQMTLPDLVSEYRRFLTLVSQTYKRIIVAVDELDKLESDEAAQAFLNSIKAIFGQQGCYYLVSVSQNAMSNFERRGLPFRDAFDSSFDDVLYVDYLNLDSSRRLVGRRVMNLPHPFVCFCYVMSGGLPRDLIRQCRSLFERQRTHVAQQEQALPGQPALPLNLYGLCESLIQSDRDAKLKALTVETRKVVLEGQTAQFIATLSAPQNGPASGALWSLLSAIETSRQTLMILQVDEALMPAKQSLLSSQRELQSYLYFLLTVAEVFCATLDMPRWQQYVAQGTFERLAAVRQLMAVNQEVAVLSAESLRRSLSLAVLPPPPPPLIPVELPPPQVKIAGT